MKTIMIAAAVLLVSGAAMAQAPSATAGATCKTTIGPKNLHGAALTSANTKCCKDAAAAQNLKGAAESSFVKACISNAS